MTVLIVSSSLDRDGYGPVADILRARGLEVAVLESDRVFAGDQQFTLEMLRNDWSLTLGRGVLKLSEVSAAWYRQPRFLTVHRDDAGIRLSIEREIRDLIDGLCDLLPENVWLNEPRRIRSASSKLHQLGVAARLGMAVPPTLLSNRWEEVESLESRSDLGVVAKMTNGTLYHDRGADLMFTQVLDRERIDSLRGSNPFPAIYQTNVDKMSEWRLTLVNGRAFSVLIQTDEDARNDWREHQLTESVRFERGTLGSDAIAGCQRMLSLYGLRYGAFDLIEGEDGSITFLEMNPNGQFGWIDRLLGLGISNAIADALTGIAHSSEPRPDVADTLVV